MDKTMRRLTAAGFGLALLSWGSVLAAEPVKLTAIQLDSITAGSANYGQKNDRGGWSGSDSTGRNSWDYYQDGVRHSSDNYPESGSSRTDGPSGGVGDQTGHTAQMNDKAQP